MLCVVFALGGMKGINGGGQVLHKDVSRAPPVLEQKVQRPKVGVDDACRGVRADGVDDSADGCGCCCVLIGVFDESVGVAVR